MPVPVGLHGEERLLEKGLLRESDLPKGNTGEESRDRLLLNDGEERADFPVGVDGE